MIKSLTFTGIIVFLMAASKLGSQEQAGREKQKSQAEIMLDEAKELRKEDRLRQAKLTYRDIVELYTDRHVQRQALQAIAEIQEHRQRYLEAQQTYERLYEKTGETPLGLQYLYQSARLKEKMGFQNQATEIYRQIVSARPGSTAAQKAKNRLKLNDLLPLNEAAN